MFIMGWVLVGVSEVFVVDFFGKVEGFLVRLMDEVMSVYDLFWKGGVEVLFESLVKGVRMGVVELGELGGWLE